MCVNFLNVTTSLKCFSYRRYLVENYPGTVLNIFREKKFFCQRYTYSTKRAPANYNLGGWTNVFGCLLSLGEWSLVLSGKGDTVERTLIPRTVRNHWKETGHKKWPGKTLNRHLTIVARGICRIAAINFLKSRNTEKHLPYWKIACDPLISLLSTKKQSFLWHKYLHKSIGFDCLKSECPKPLNIYYTLRVCVINFGIMFF